MVGSQSAWKSKARLIGSNGTQLVVHDTTLGVRSIPSLTQANVYRNSFAEVTAAARANAIGRSRAVEVALGDLTADGVRDLLLDRYGTVPGRRLAEWLHDRTDGNLLNANAGTSKFGVVACENFAPINTTASLQLLSSGGLAQNFYICSFQIVVSIADNVALVEGTGATCGTSTAGVFGGATAATGWNLPANGQVSIGSGLGMIGKTTVAGNNLCLLVSSAAQISGGFTWTQF